MKWKKPHYNKKGKSQQINPVARQLFSVTKAPISQPEQQPCLDQLVNVFYDSTPEACIFWYSEIAGPVDQ